MKEAGPAPASFVFAPKIPVLQAFGAFRQRSGTAADGGGEGAEGTALNGRHIMRFIKPAAVAMALTVGAVSFATSAQADHRRHHRIDPGAAAVIGIFGLAAGAMLSGALSQPRYHHGPRYHHEPRRYHQPRYYHQPRVYAPPPPPAPVYYNRPAPWTPAWYAYCDARYRSFNPTTGHFLGYDGHYHFCR